MSSTILLVVFAGLTIFSAMALIMALILVLIDAWKDSTSNDAAVRSDSFAKGVGDDWADSNPQKSVNNGKAQSFAGEMSISFSEIKNMIKCGHRREAMPVLLGVAGLLGLLLFGSLALFVALDNKLIGGLIAAVAVFSVVRMLIRMLQA